MLLNIAKEHIVSGLNVSRTVIFTSMAEERFWKMHNGRIIHVKVKKIGSFVFVCWLKIIAYKTKTRGISA